LKKTLLIFLLYACSNISLGQSKAIVHICFEHLFQETPILADSTFIQMDTDSLRFRQWKYYVGNMYLNEHPVSFETEKYLLVNGLDGNRCYTGETLSGKYNLLRFRIGIDSADQATGARSGSLDPLNNMYWTWNSGYIAFKLEGESSKAPPPLYRFEHHLGGYRSYQSFQPQIDLLREQPMVISPDKENRLTIRVELDKYWQDKSTSSIRNIPIIMQPGAAARAQAAAVSSLFSWK
jgi:hypothetical protein